MKKLLLFITIFLITTGLTGCVRENPNPGPDPDPDPDPIICDEGFELINEVCVEIEENYVPKLLSVSIQDEIVVSNRSIFMRLSNTTSLSDYFLTEQEHWLVIELENNTSYEILSVTINDIKYQIGAKEDPLDENSREVSINIERTFVYVPIITNNIPGEDTYIVNNIKYIDGTEIKDVDKGTVDDFIVLSLIQIIAGNLYIYSVEDFYTIPVGFTGQLFIANDLVIDNFVTLEKCVDIKSDAAVITFNDADVVLCNTGTDMLIENTVIKANNLTINAQNLNLNNVYITANVFTVDNLNLEVAIFAIQNLVYSSENYMIIVNESDGVFTADPMFEEITNIVIGEVVDGFIEITYDYSGNSMSATIPYK